MRRALGTGKVQPEGSEAGPGGAGGRVSVLGAHGLLHAGPALKVAGLSGAAGQPARQAAPISIPSLSDHVVGILFSAAD